MTATEKKIVEACKAIPNAGMGNFHYYEQLANAIARAMGYEMLPTTNDWEEYTCLIMNVGDAMKVDQIIKGMVKQGIIQMSYSGSTWRLA